MTRPGKRRIVVVGDVVLDCDLLGHTERICPDAPVPVVDVDGTFERPGAAGLTALLCLADDVDVTLVAPVAEDGPGERLMALLSSSGVRVIALPHYGNTRRKTRVRSAGQSLLRLDEGGPGTTHGPVPPEAEQAIRMADVILVSDYGAGTTAHAPLLELLAVMAGRRLVCWDPHPRGTDPVGGCALVTPNLAEARATVGDAHAVAEQLARVLVRQWAARAVAVTAGEIGAWLATSADEPYFVAAPVVPALDSCGAGDRFAATAAQSLARGAVPSEAVASAVAEASAWVAKGGAAAFWADKHPTVPAREKLGSDGAFDLVARVRQRGGTIVATGGCFDVLHAGHVSSLEAAARLGDALVVLLNSDRSVRRLKGPDRPAQPSEDRARLLLALSTVDAVVVFEEDDPCTVLDRLRPEVWVKGGDYDATALPELDLVRSWGGRVVLLPYLAGRSTSAILKTTTTRGAPS